MKAVDRVVFTLDRWQRSHRLISVLFAVIKKFGDDELNQFVVGLGWYGFVAIYPLLLVAVTVLGFIGAASLGNHVVTTLHEFPVVGPLFNPARRAGALHGSGLGLVIGVAGLLYGAQGVTQTAQLAMARAWNIPQVEVPGFLQRLARSVTGLAVISAAFVGNAALATLATGSGHTILLRALLLIGMVVANLGLYVAAFRVLTPAAVPLGVLVPGGAIAAIGFTFLITLGSGLVQHQVRNSSATYGQFGIVIGLVAFLFLLAKVSLYGVELNPVLHRHLWPRGLGATNPTDADNRVLRDIVHQNRRRPDQRIGVGFGDTAEEQVAVDAAHEHPRSGSAVGIGEHGHEAPNRPQSPR